MRLKAKIGDLTMSNELLRFFLSTRFPGEGRVQKRAPGAGELTLEDVFFSNVSSAARKKTLERFPFDEELIMSEDQKFSKDLLEDGLTVAYVPESVVIHSHAYSLTDVFRIFRQRPLPGRDIPLPHHGDERRDGICLSRQGMAAHRRPPPEVDPLHFLYTVAKTMGTVAGHCAPWLPRPVLRRISLHSYHWNR
jgi:rhamnosyltransferase